MKMNHKLLNRFYHMLLYYSPYQSRNGDLFITLVTKYKMENYRGNMTLIPTLKTPLKGINYFCKKINKLVNT